MLVFRQFRAPFRRLPGVLQFTIGVASIAFLEFGDCFGGSYSRLFGMSRISCSRKLICAEQTDCDEARCELCGFHAVIYEGTGLFVQFESQNGTKQCMFLRL